jgi:hypothetical protein
MSAPSAAKLAANQSNAQLSTGPTSPDGKHRSSLNATRHGLTGRVVVLPSEDMKVYEVFSQELIASLDPKTPLERELAQTVVDQQWRLNRVRTIEDAMLAVADAQSETRADHPAVDSALAAGQAFLENSKAFVNLTIYEQRIHRIMEKALAQLKQLQAERKVLEQAQMEEALKLQRLHESQGKPYDPQADGFVFSSADLCREAALRERLVASQFAIPNRRPPMPKI